MFGCIGKVVVAALLIVVAAVGYVTRGWWEPRLRERLGVKPAAVASAPAWEPITRQGAERARVAIESFRRPTGPVFVNVKAGDLVAYALDPVSRGLSAGATTGTRSGTPDAALGAEALAGENVISVRGNVRMSDLGGAAALGPLAGVLEGTQRIEVRGRLEIPAPGSARIRVERIAIGNLVLPSAAIGRVVQRIAPRTDPATPAEAVVLTLPSVVADVRVTGGRVTLYKAVK